MTHSIRLTCAHNRHETATQLKDYRAAASDLNFGNQKFTIDFLSDSLDIWRT